VYEQCLRGMREVDSLLPMAGLEPAEGYMQALAAATGHEISGWVAALSDAARPEMSDAVCDMLLRPSEGGTPWEKLLVSNASPKLTMRLMRTPRLAIAAQSLEPAPQGIGA
jgi:hypothetical protein